MTRSLSRGPVAAKQPAKHVLAALSKIVLAERGGKGTVYLYYLYDNFACIEGQGTSVFLSFDFDCVIEFGCSYAGTTNVDCGDGYLNRDLTRRTVSLFLSLSLRLTLLLGL